MKVTVQRDQSLADIAIQYCGSVEAMYALAAVNGLNVSDEVLPGDTLVLPGVSDATVRKYYNERILKPITIIQDSLRTQEGIEFWALELDFAIGGIDEGIAYWRLESDFEVN